MTLSIQLTGTGAGRVTSSPVGIDCPGHCSAQFASGTSVTVTATPADGSAIKAFSSGCTGTTCTLALNADASLEVDLERVPAQPERPDRCAGLAAPREEAMQQYVSDWGDYDEDMMCGPPVGDASGILALPLLHSHLSDIELIRASDATVTGQADSEGYWDTLYPQQQGFFALGFPYLGSCAGAPLVESWSDLGGRNAGTWVARADAYAAAANPTGGLLLAGDFAIDPVNLWRCDDQTVQQHVAVMLPAGDSAILKPKWGPVALASPGAVFGDGVDALGRALVITDGTPTFGPGVVSAQWFDVNGKPLTGEFVLLRDFTPGSDTWFETDRLIGGGLLVQRVDGLQGLAEPVPAHTHARAMVALASGATTPQAPPEWTLQRPDTRLQIIDGGKGYAVLPLGALNVPCTQKLEVVASDGTSCGAREYPIASGKCNTNDLRLGADGTVLQQLPTEMEPIASPDFPMNRCTWRWWPSAVR